MTTWLYDFSTTVTEPPGPKELRFNAVYPYTAVTKVWPRIVNASNQDIHLALLGIVANSRLYIQDENDHTRYAAFTTLTAPIDKGDYVELSVTWYANGGAAIGNNQRIGVLVSGPVLITLTDAKAHLHLASSDTSHDADVNLKRQQASAMVMKYLKAQADPTWTETTVPLPVQAAIFMLLDHLYENRGDDMSRDETVWMAVDRCVKQFRDPALA